MISKAGETPMDLTVVYTASLLLLVAPPFDDAIPLTADPLVYQALKDQAEMLELFNRDSVSWGHFTNEARLVRANWRRWGDCPPEHDRCWLPPHAFCRDAVRFADRFVDHMDGLLAWSLRKEELREVREAALKLRNVWAAARDATESGPGIIYRRKALAVLRSGIGADAYRRGEMPPWVPYWLFDEGVGYDHGP